MTCDAPILIAVEMGVLRATPPSMRNRPASSTGGKRAGIAALASRASAADPVALPYFVSADDRALTSESSASTTVRVSVDALGTGVRRPCAGFHSIRHEGRVTRGRARLPATIAGPQGVRDAAAHHHRRSRAGARMGTAQRGRAVDERAPPRGAAERYTRRRYLRPRAQRRAVPRTACTSVTPGPGAPRRRRPREGSRQRAGQSPGRAGPAP